MFPVFNNKKFDLPNQMGKGKRFLDIGCGDGKIQKLGKKKTTACRMIGDGNGYIDSIYYSNSVVNAGFGKKNDVIYCNHVFEHANNPLEFLEKVKLLLKDDRIYIFIYIVSVGYG